MALRIICLEEHYMTEEMFKELAPAAAKVAASFADWGSEFEDQPESFADDLPHLQGKHHAFASGTADMEDRLKAMDADGIDMQVLSVGNPVQALPTAQGIDLARRLNDRLAEIAKAHPTRLAGFFTLPWQDPDAAMREAERAVKDLHLTATLLGGRPGDELLIDDFRYDPVLAKLAELAAPIYLHPGPPLPAVQRPYYSGFSKEVTSRFSCHAYGWHNEAGIQVIRLILAGALDRYPNLRVISGHWGELVPFYLQRLDDCLPREVTHLTRTVSQTYRDQVYITPSGMLYTPNFEFCKQVLGGVNKMLFAIDYPYYTMTGARRWLETLSISEDERVAFAHGNAERLLKLR